MGEIHPPYIYQNLKSSGVNALNQEKGMNFGHSESENALFLDMFA